MMWHVKVFDAIDIISTDKHVGALTLIKELETPLMVYMSHLK